METACECGKSFIRHMPSQTLCKACKRREWRSKNRNKLNRYQKQLYHQSNSKRKDTLAALKRSYVNTLKGRLAELAAQAKTKSKPGTAASKTWTKSGLVCDIDTDFLVDLWESQRGLCAISGLQMNYNLRDLRSVSLDRINSSFGYAKNNVQLVCKWANRAKNNATSTEMAGIISDLRKVVLDRP